MDKKKVIKRTIYNAGVALELANKGLHAVGVVFCGVTNKLVNQFVKVDLGDGKGGLNLFTKGVNALAKLVQNQGEK